MALRASTLGSFSVGMLSVRPGGPIGCGGNPGVAATVSVSAANHVFVGGQRAGEGGGDGWLGPDQPGGAKADACGMRWTSQPIPPGPGSTPLHSAWAPNKNPAGTYTLYVSGATADVPVVAHSSDSGGTFVNSKLPGRVGAGGRPWIAAHGVATSMVSFGDQVSGTITVLRSDDEGATYAPVGPVLPVADRRTGNLRLGNLVIDHRDSPGAATGEFWAYQSFLATTNGRDRTINQPSLAASKDGGRKWSLHTIGCGNSKRSLASQTPSVSVAPDGSLWYAWSDGVSVYTALSRDHGATWKCSGSLTPGLVAATDPSVVATSSGVDLSFYGAASRDEWSLYFAQNLTAKIGDWLGAEELISVHHGTPDALVAPSLDVDQLGWLHMGYALDGTDQDTATLEVCYAVQTGGTQVGFPN